MDNDQQTDFGFTTVSAGEKTRKVREVFDSVASKYDLMNDLMSFGLHRFWKKFMVAAARLRPGARVLDLAGGTGDISRLLAKSLNGTGTVVLTDINQSMLMIGRDRCIDENLDENITYAQVDAQQLPFDDYEFDLVTIAFGLRNVTDKNLALGEIFRVLKPGSKLLILEFSKLQVNALTPIYDRFSFDVLPKIGQVVAKDAASYRYLAESIRQHPDQQTLVAMMNEAGFERCKFHNILGGVVALHEGMRL
ncbi:MAG: bifunctional demethylmenaquinone methyltransferase/2-methoxy-6-polyprenyl-1,4-benzoquinol methylase UbiE [Gammaproteobacteria bacterium]